MPDPRQITTNMYYKYTTGLCVKEQKWVETWNSEGLSDIISDSSVLVLKYDPFE